MQYKIPQNVRIEDKIVGPLTLKQLIIVAIGGGMAYVSYIYLANRYSMAGWLPPVAFISIITMAIAFLKINGIPFSRWVLLMVEYFKNPRKRTFILGSAEVYEKSLFAETKKEEQNKSEEKTPQERRRERRSKIESISKVLDDYNNPSI